MRIEIVLSMFAAIGVMAMALGYGPSRPEVHVENPALFVLGLVLFVLAVLSLIVVRTKEEEEMR